MVPPTNRLIIGADEPDSCEHVSSGTTYAGSIGENYPVTPRREWLRLDTTEDESILSDATVVSAGNTVTSATTTTSHIPLPTFPEPPKGTGLGGLSVYPDNYPRKTNSAAGSVSKGKAAAMKETLSSAGRDGTGDKDQTPSRHTASRGRDDGEERGRPGVTDFFGAEVYQVVLRNPTTAHRLMKFCQSRACGENMEFLEKVAQYNRLLDEVATLLGDIHSTYTGQDASRQINISGGLCKRITSDIKTTTQSTIPAMEQIFVDAQDQVEKLLCSDIYPRFVKHQMTISASLALADDRARYQGLGDCFCLTDPNIADNPIVYASDGFVDVTGYERKDIVPRNCRFLQGRQTDRTATKRLRASIDNAQETVELLLNYRKNGDPFWNLLYVTPLYDESGRIAFFLGGQINCSTTIHSNTDVLKILSLNDDDSDSAPSLNDGRPAATSINQPSYKTRNNFFKSWKQISARNGVTAGLRPEVGQEGELLGKIEKMSFKTQVEAFYTAYSKYLVMAYSSKTGDLLIKHYSSTIIDLLCLHLPNGAIAPICNKDVFRIFTEYNLAPDTKTFRSAKQSIKDAARADKAVSLDLNLLTGSPVRKMAGGFSLGGNKKMEWVRGEEKFVTHWTPMKDEHGRTKYVIMSVAPK